MFGFLKGFFALAKKEAKHDVCLAFAEPLLSSIKQDISKIDESLGNIRHLVDSGFRIGFDKVPSVLFYDLIGNINEFSAVIESSDVPDRIELIELLAHMHDDAVRCSGLVSFMVSSSMQDVDLQNVMKCFIDLKGLLGAVCQLM